MRLLSLLVLLCFGLSLPALSGKRIALVIGNSDYEHVVDLKNPANDADLMEKALKEVGFEVTRLRNLNQRAMKQAMVEFGRKLKEGADASMFYYAGHGIEVNGINYLVPVDADIRSSDEADIQNVDVNSFLALASNTSVPLNIVILDACRNNPFRGIRTTAGGGLAPVQAPRGTYVAYATSPGAVAADGEGDNSPFTLALSESMRQPGLNLEAVLKQTRLKVQEATAGAQLPFDSSAITGDFYFVPAVAQETPAQKQGPAVSPQDPAQAAFEAAGEDPDLLAVVAERFGESVWGALAAEKLKKIRPPAALEVPAVKVDVPKPAVVPTENQQEENPPPAASVEKKSSGEIEIPPVKASKEPAPPTAKPVDKRVSKSAVVAKPKARFVQPKPIVRKVVPAQPKPVIVIKKPVAAKLLSCGSNQLRVGMMCKAGGTQVCRVAAIRHGRRDDVPVLLGCH